MHICSCEQSYEMRQERKYKCYSCDVSMIVWVPDRLRLKALTLDELFIRNIFHVICKRKLSEIICYRTNFWIMWGVINLQYAKLRHSDMTSKFSSVDSFRVPAGRDVLMHTDNNTSQPPITSRHTLTRHNTPVWRHSCAWLFNYLATLLRKCANNIFV